MNYRLELEINRQKLNLIEFQFRTIQRQIAALEESKKDLLKQHRKLSDEGQRLAEENDALLLGFLDKAELNK